VLHFPPLALPDGKCNQVGTTPSYGTLQAALSDYRPVPHLSLEYPVHRCHGNGIGRLVAIAHLRPRPDELLLRFERLRRPRRDRIRYRPYLPPAAACACARACARVCVRRVRACGREEGRVGLEGVVRTASMAAVMLWRLVLAMCAALPSPSSLYFSHELSGGTGVGTSGSCASVSYLRRMRAGAAAYWRRMGGEQQGSGNGRRAAGEREWEQQGRRRGVGERERGSVARCAHRLHTWQ
jgi:hypothetical protein